MIKIIEKILADYKRANKAAKLKMIAKYGFKTEKEFLNYCSNTETKTKETVKSKKKSSKKEEDSLDVIVAFDTTGSMSSYIESVKAHVKELIPNMFKNTPNLRMKIVAFGDYCDMVSATEFGRAYQESELTNNENELINFVSKAENTGGGDGDEFYELVIQKIVDETPWGKGQKAIMLIGDAGPHKVGYSYGGIVTKAQVDWKKEAEKAAKLGVKIDTLKIHNHIKWYDELSKITNGLCLNFKNSEKISEVIIGTTTARAASYSPESAAYFSKTMSAVMDSGDDELIGAYKQINTLL